MKIKSIEKGTGEDSTYFTTVQGIGWHVDSIETSMKLIGNGQSGVLSLLVYRGFKNDELVFEIEAGSQITLIYEKEDNE